MNHLRQCPRLTVFAIALGSANASLQCDKCDPNFPPSPQNAVHELGTIIRYILRRLNIEIGAASRLDGHRPTKQQGKRAAQGQACHFVLNHAFTHASSIQEICHPAGRCFGTRATSINTAAVQDAQRASTSRPSTPSITPHQEPPHMHFFRF